MAPVWPGSPGSPGSLGSLGSLERRSSRQKAAFAAELEGAGDGRPWDGTPGVFEVNRQPARATLTPFDAYDNLQGAFFWDWVDRAVRWPTPTTLTTSDESANGFTARAFGDVVDGVAGKALKGYATLPHAPELDITGKLTPNTASTPTRTTPTNTA